MVTEKFSRLLAQAIRTLSRRKRKRWRRRMYVHTRKLHVCRTLEHAKVLWQAKYREDTRSGGYLTPAFPAKKLSSRFSVFSSSHSSFLCRACRPEPQEPAAAQPQCPSLVPGPVSFSIIFSDPGTIPAASETGKKCQKPAKVGPSQTLSALSLSSLTCHNHSARAEGS